MYRESTLNIGLNIHTLIGKCMNTEITLLASLKNQLVAFLDELVETFPNEPDFVIFRIFVQDRIPADKIMEYIVENLCPLEKEVDSKDDSFFLQRNVLFEKFDDSKSEKVNHFKTLWLSGTLDETEKDTIWRWFKRFITLGNKYSNLVQKDKECLAKVRKS